MSSRCLLHQALGVRIFELGRCLVEACNTLSLGDYRVLPSPSCFFQRIGHASPNSNDRLVQKLLWWWVSIRFLWLQEHEDWDKIAGKAIDDQKAGIE